MSQKCISRRIFLLKTFRMYDNTQGWRKLKIFEGATTNGPWKLWGPVPSYVLTFWNFGEASGPPVPPVPAALHPIKQTNNLKFHNCWQSRKLHPAGHWAVSRTFDGQLLSQTWRSCYPYFCCSLYVHRIGYCLWRLLRTGLRSHRWG